MKVFERGNTPQRRAAILKLLEKEGQISVGELSKHFKVSEVTIRNDLAQLSQQGLLIRTRGGAIWQPPLAIDFHLREKLKLHPAEKRRIGHYAAQLVQDGETVILDSGTTTLEIAHALVRQEFRQLTVVTNALNIAIVLANHAGIRVIMPGGVMRQNALSLVGPIAESSFQNLYCDRAFIGVDGIVPEEGIYTPNHEEAYLNRLMIAHSRQAVVVTDSSKFGKKSFARIAPLDQLDLIITDRHLPNRFLQSLQEQNLRVITV